MNSAERLAFSPPTHWLLQAPIPNSGYPIVPDASKFMTMRELAQIAGVDQSTVSLALRHSPRIAPATREKILHLAEQHGYIPNPLVSACMDLRKRTHIATHAHTTLAFLINGPPEASWRRRSTVPLNYNGALHQAEHRGYKLEEFFIPAGLTGQRICQILQTRNVHGVIVAPLSDEGSSQLDFIWKHFCAVAIGLSLTTPPLHHVAHDYYQGMRLAMNEARKRGFRRPGFVIDDRTNVRIQNNWMAAYLIEQQFCEPSNRLAPFVFKSCAFDHRAFLQWGAEQRPDVIMGIPLWLNIMPWKELLGGLPEPVEWIHLDVKNRNGDQAGIHQNHEKIGATAVDLLIRLVERNQSGPLENSETLLIEGSWVEGKLQRQMTAVPSV